MRPVRVANPNFRVIHIVISILVTCAGHDRNAVAKCATCTKRIIYYIVITYPLQTSPCVVICTTLKITGCHVVLLICTGRPRRPGFKKQSPPAPYWGWGRLFAVLLQHLFPCFCEFPNYFAENIKEINRLMSRLWLYAPPRRIEQKSSPAPAESRGGGAGRVLAMLCRISQDSG